MALLVYKFSDYEHTAEREQYRSLCKQLKAYYENRDEICIFIANYNIYNCELDGMIIKQDAIMAIEFKNFGGTITAVENGHWKDSDGNIVKGGSRKTVYQQANLNHVAIKRGFEDGNILPAETLKNVAALVVFHQPIELNNKLSARTQSWLYVCDETTFLEKVQDITSNSIDFSKEDMIDLIDKLALDEDYLAEEYSNVNVLHKVEEETVPVAAVKTEVSKPIVQELDEERQDLHDFVERILKQVLKRDDCIIQVFHSSDVQPLFDSYGITFTKEYVITVEAEGVGAASKKIERFISHSVRAVKPNLIFWEDGVELENSASKDEKGSCVNNEAETLVYEAPKPIDNSIQIKNFRKSKTILPHWLDNLLFNSLEARYAPEHERYEYNLDLNEEDIKVYLGTYFPRSYAEVFCIYDNLLSHSNYRQIIYAHSSVNILDMGCGTGGELLGLVTALSKHIETPITININACDGNEMALTALNDICIAAKKYTHHNINISIYKKTFAFKTKLEVKDVDQTVYDIILCDKVVCELISHSIMPDKAYQKVAKSLSPLLSEDGILILLDVTTKDEISGLFYPQLMNPELNKFTLDCPEFQTLLPLSCGLNKQCVEACFMQQTFYVSHSHRTNDESRVCYRVLCRASLKERMNLPIYENTGFIIHPIKYKQGDESSICKYSSGKNIIDSFNII